MSSTLNRRFFLGASLASSTVALGDVSWLSWLASDAAEVKIAAVLSKHFGPDFAQKALVRAFIARLQTPGLHTESPETFAAMLRGSEGEMELESYIVEEFIVGSSYLGLINGRTSKIEILPA